VTDAAEAARRWVDGWSRAWPAGDADAVAELYTEDAVYSSHPFREPYRGAAGAREYAAQAFVDEELVEVRFGDPVASGHRAAVEYWAVLRTGGKDVTLVGTTVLRFAPDGRVEDHREYWAIEDGARRPPDGWGA
jgi:ketosteroid isomerase-like protein